MRVAAELTDFVGAKERKSARTPVTMPAGYREGHRRGDVTVVDLSPSGVKIESYLLLEPNALIWLKLPGLESWQARVAWVDRNVAGCEFLRPLHPAVFERVVAVCRANGFG